MELSRVGQLTITQLEQKANDIRQDIIHNARSRPEAAIALVH